MKFNFYTFIIIVLNCSYTYKLVNCNKKMFDITLSRMYFYYFSYISENAIYLRKYLLKILLIVLNDVTL